ncbi:MAG TPA: uroporphyrinogen decarboxylase family protein [Spirochaetia bacterium]|nr:uroporphyrinogen decarboxylase family protein [Spirochaetia bacterium]
MPRIGSGSGGSGGNTDGTDSTGNTDGRDSMDSRERVTAAVDHRQPDRTPAYCGRIDDLEFWKEAFRVPDEAALRAHFQLDLRKTTYKGLFNVEPGRTIWGTADEWDAGYNVRPGGFPLAAAETVREIEAWRWPRPEDVDYQELRRRQEGLDPRFASILSFGWQPVFCTLLDLFGMEQALVLMHTAPAVIEAAVAHIECFLLEEMRRALERCAPLVQFYWCGDDFSTQRGLMISPEAWRRFLKPSYRRMFELVKSFDLKVWFHSCGTFRPVLPDLVDMGMDVWETVQVHLEGNDPHELKREFGKQITFFGAISCQHTLPFGTPEDVRAEVRERVRVLGKGGGYICGPDHSIQKNMPPQNLAALWDEARRLS